VEVSCGASGLFSALRRLSPPATRCFCAATRSSLAGIGCGVADRWDLIAAALLGFGGGLRSFALPVALAIRDRGPLAGPAWADGKEPASPRPLRWSPRSRVRGCASSAAWPDATAGVLEHRRSGTRSRSQSQWTSEPNSLLCGPRPMVSNTYIAAEPEPDRTSTGRAMAFALARARSSERSCPIGAEGQEPSVPFPEARAAHAAPPARRRRVRTLA
jgi:hypothetical protein